MNKLYIITGPAGVGKTTVSKKIAESLKKSVLIEGDEIYNFFVGGKIKPWLPEAPLQLFWNNCIYLIKSYLDNGYDVVFNYIVKPESFKKLQTIFLEYEIIFKVLLTDEKTIIERDKKRPINCQMGQRSLILLHKFIEYNYEKKYVLDTTNMSIEDTVKNIVKYNN